MLQAIDTEDREVRSEAWERNQRPLDWPQLASYVTRLVGVDKLKEAISEQ